MHLTPRLSAAAELVRDGAVLADVGTDHALLPIYLLLAGRIGFAHLSDINKGPLSRAEENVISNSLEGKVAYHLTSGAVGLSGLGITDYTICGMGGELIADILRASPHLLDEGINLILQPMTRPEALRRYLFDTGYDILKEKYVFDDGKYYVVINARYKGERLPYTDADLYFGKPDAFDKSEAGIGYLTLKEKTLIKVTSGKERGGADASGERELLLAIKERLNSI